MERLMFGWDFEVDAWSRFWKWNLIKICVWTCDIYSTLGSVVPLAMFLLYMPDCCNIEMMIYRSWNVQVTPFTLERCRILPQLRKERRFPDFALLKLCCEDFMTFCVLIWNPIWGCPLPMLGAGSHANQNTKTESATCEKSLAIPSRKKVVLMLWNRRGHHIIASAKFLYPSASQGFWQFSICAIFMNSDIYSHLWGSSSKQEKIFQMLWGWMMIRERNWMSALFRRWVD